MQEENPQNSPDVEKVSQVFSTSSGERFSPPAAGNFFLGGAREANVKASYPQTVQDVWITPAAMEGGRQPALCSPFVTAEARFA